jgi:nucleoside-triphosphatase
MFIQTNERIYTKGVSMKIFITGLPRCGKTTLIKELIKECKVSFSGFLSEEIRNDDRIGFKIEDVRTSEEGILANMDFKDGPKIGKYFVNIKDIERIAIPSLEREANFYFIDEIGAMELKSKKFEKVLEAILSSNKNIIATLHRNYANKYKKYGELIWLTKENWNEIFEKIKSRLNEN